MMTLAIASQVIRGRRAWPRVEARPERLCLAGDVAASLAAEEPGSLSCPPGERRQVWAGPLPR
jgi:hypothetical protein